MRQSKSKSAAPSLPSRADDILLGWVHISHVAGNLHHIDVVYEKYLVVVQSLRHDYNLFDNLRTCFLTYS